MGNERGSDEKESEEGCAYMDVFVLPRQEGHVTLEPSRGGLADEPQARGDLGRADSECSLAGLHSVGQVDMRDWVVSLG